MGFVGVREWEWVEEDVELGGSCYRGFGFFYSGVLELGGFFDIVFFWKRVFYVFIFLLISR